MRVCGKALPPRAALLLTFDFASLVFVMPLLFMFPVLANPEQKPLSALLLSLARLMVAGLACQAVFYYHELYNLQIVQRPSAVLVRVLRAFGLLFFLLSLACLALPNLAPTLSRVLLFSAFLALIAVLARMLALPRVRERVLILSAGEEAAELQETILECPEWNIEITQILQPSKLDSLLPEGTDPFASYDRIIVSDAKAQSPSALQRMLDWKMRGLPIEDAQGFYERATGRVRVDSLTADQCIFSYKYDNNAGKRRVKRAFDLVASTLLLLLASPLILAVAILIWSRRDGDIVFKQERTGLNGKPIRIYKFRTMRSAPAGSEARWASDETHRITPVGAFLRKYRLDELLQLVNIVKGDMSLVGPRPEQPQFCQLLAERIPFYQQRHSVPPGLTGWAQVKYHYGSSIEESKRKLEYDLFYVKHLSLWLDCAILLETVKVVLVGRGSL
ncbi:MAG: exopolysaccharide biosynthesis polyprenyl glycosylphosphotransferase [Acidobacteriaceae bacterium]